MDGQVIPDNDVAWAAGRGQAYFTIGFEHVAVHRVIDDQGRGDPVVAQAGDEDCRFLMPVRNRGEEPFAFAGATIKPGHFCRCPGFVNEDRRFGSNRCCPARRVIRVSVTSGLSCAAACAVYFNADLMAIKEPPDRVNANPQTASPRAERYSSSDGSGASERRVKRQSIGASMTAERQSPPTP